MALKDRIYLRSGEYDGASAIAHHLNTQTSLVTAGAKLFAVYNASVEKFSIDKDGVVQSAPNSTLSFKSYDQNTLGTECFVFDTNVTHVFDESKIMAIKNNGTEVWNVNSGGRTSNDAFLIVDPSEGSAGIQAAINLIDNYGGGTIQLKEGTYTVDSRIDFGGANNRIVLKGAGPNTILEHDGVLATHMILLSGAAGGVYALNGITKNDTSIYTTTVAQAGNVSEGDRLWFYGTDADGLEDLEINEAAADGNPTTGEIQLTRESKRTLTSPNLLFITNGEGHEVRDLRMTTSSLVATLVPIYMVATAYCTIENVVIEGMDGGVTYGNLAVHGRGIGNVVKNCKIKNATNIGISIYDQWGLKVINNTLENTAHTPGTNIGAITLGNKVYDTIISGNHIERSGSRGIYTPGNYRRRISISNNNISNIERGCIQFTNDSADISIIGNFLDSCDGQSFVLTGLNRGIIKGNTVLNVSSGGGISLATCAYISVEGNIIHKVGSFNGIYFQSVTYSNISNNVIQDCDADGIQTDASSTDLVISNNIIENSSVNGMRINGDDCTIIGNHVRSGGTGPGIRVEGDDCIVSSNNCKGEGITLNGAGVTSGLNKS